MAVDFNNFVEWAEARFGDILIQGDEIRINSIFDPTDSKYKMWCSPSGGKRNRRDGVYHCWKTGEKGTLAKLVMKVDLCDYEEAISRLKGKTPLRDLEEQVEEFFRQQDEIQEKKEKIKFPANTFEISEMGVNNWWRQHAENYLNKRKIPIDGLYICTDGMYKNRIIIPYYDRLGNLIYWNGRHLGNSKAKYRGPDKEEFGIGKSDVIYMTSWPPAGNTVYICEGEFNAKSIALSGLNAGACGGKEMNQKQANMLSIYKVVICIDRDKAGVQGLTNMVSRIMESNFQKELQFVRPAMGFKDWNEMLVDVGPKIMRGYIEKTRDHLRNQDMPFGTSSALFEFEDLL